MGSVLAPRFAIVFKTHFWDGFAERQFRRYENQAGGADIFAYLDETNGRIEVPGDVRAIRATNAQLIADGYADRFERGSLLWWNTDYPNYRARQALPGYDYYLFVEYDTCVLGQIDRFVADAALRGLDLVALRTRTPLEKWMWTRFHARTYDMAELAGSLNCISLQSRAAVDLLARRRREMTLQSAQGGVAFWPGNEVFLPTEIGRAGLQMADLAEFGDVARYEWHPPMLEDDLPDHANGPTIFVHPVLDRKRYIASLLKFENDLGAYLRPRSALQHALARFPAEEWRPQLGAAFRARLLMRARERIEGVGARLRNIAGRQPVGA